MTGINFDINADSSQIVKSVDEITEAVNQLAESVSKSSGKKINPIDTAAAVKDLEKLNKGFELAVKQSKSLRDALKNTGQTGKSITDVDFSKLALDKGAAQRLRDKAFGFSARGTVWDTGNFAPAPTLGGNQNRSMSTRSFFQSAGSTAFSTVGQFASGVNGGLGQVVNSSISGARVGAEEGGAAGGAMGLLKGFGIASLALGAMKIGQGVGEGYDMAKERSASLDTLKRELGDLGVSFRGLTAMTDAASQGLGVNSKEFAALAVQYSKLAKDSQDKSPEALGERVRDAVQFSRAYGIDASHGVNFFGAMKNIDPKQNNRELASQIAEAIDKSGGRAMAPDVMEFMQTMSSAVSRMSLSMPNTAAMAAGFGSMLQNGVSVENASSILGQANSSLMRGGGAGEAGHNFLFQALNKDGKLNSVQVSELLEGGLFASKESIFGKNSANAKFYKSALGGGFDIGKSIGLENDPNKNVTNFEKVKNYFDEFFKDSKNANNKELRQVMVQGAGTLFGTSLAQTKELLMMSPSATHGIQNAMNMAGIKDFSKLSMGGIQTFARVGNAKSKDDLNAIVEELKKRTGIDALSDDEKRNIADAQGKTTEELQKVLLEITLSKDQQSTEAKRLLASIKDLETVQTAIGSKMIEPMNVMRDALLKMSGGTAKSLHKAAYEAEVEDATAPIDEQIKATSGELDKVLHPFDPLGNGADGGISPDFLRVQQEKAKPFEEKLKKLQAERAAIVADLAAKEDSYQHTQNELKVAQEANGAELKKNQAAYTNLTGSGITPKISPKLDADATENLKILYKVNQFSDFKTTSLLQAQMLAESDGHNLDSKGNLKASYDKYGNALALGAMQIRPSTALAPGLGVAPLKNWSVESQAIFQRDYMSALTKHYNGDEHKALAAYNWGIGKMDGYKDPATGKHVMGLLEGKHKNEYKKYLPNETIAYIKKIDGYRGYGDKLPSNPMSPNANQNQPIILNSYVTVNAADKNGKITTTEHKNVSEFGTPKSVNSTSNVVSAL